MRATLFVDRMHGRCSPPTRARRGAQVNPLTSCGVLPPTNMEVEHESLRQFSSTNMPFSTSMIVLGNIDHVATGGLQGYSRTPGLASFLVDCSPGSARVPERDRRSCSSRQGSPPPHKGLPRDWALLGT